MPGTSPGRSGSPCFSLGLFAAVFAAVLSAAVPALCGDIELKAEADKTEVAVGDVVSFSVTVSGVFEEAPRVEIGSFDGFSVVATRQAQQIRVEKGKKVQSVVLLYALASGAPGDYSLGPVKVEYKGHTYETKPVRIKVVPGSPARPRLRGGVIL